MRTQFIALNPVVNYAYGEYLFLHCKTDATRLWDLPKRLESKQKRIFFIEILLFIEFINRNEFLQSYNGFCNVLLHYIHTRVITLMANHRCLALKIVDHLYSVCTLCSLVLGEPFFVSFLFRISVALFSPHCHNSWSFLCP